MTCSDEPVFVDTSGLFAILDADDAHHAAAGRCWRRWIEGQVHLLTSNYVVVETTALVRSRLGMAAVGDLHRAVVPMVKVEWITRPVHEAALNALLGTDQHGLSLVDCTSFRLMEMLKLQRAFSFDRRFAERGFLCVPQEG